MFSASYFQCYKADFVFDIVKFVVCKNVIVFSEIGCCSFYKDKLVLGDKEPRTYSKVQTFTVLANLVYNLQNTQPIPTIPALLLDVVGWWY